MKVDPPVRADGRCARRGCGKLVTPPKRPQKGVDPAVYATDPWCSTDCCRLYYGLPVAKPVGSKNKRAYVDVSTGKAAA